MFEVDLAMPEHEVVDAGIGEAAEAVDGGAVGGVEGEEESGEECGEGEEDGGAVEEGPEAGEKWDARFHGWSFLVSEVTAVPHSGQLVPGWWARRSKEQVGHLCCIFNRRAIRQALTRLYQ